MTKQAHPETRASLLQRVRDPADNEAWREFFNIYRPLIYRYGRLRGLSRADADEVVQKCMTKLVDKMPQFEYSSTKGGFKFWLRRVTNNLITDIQRKRKTQLAESGDFRRPQEREPSVDELWEREWERKHLQHFLHELEGRIAPTTYKAFEYYVLSDWPVERVMSELGVTADQVYAAKSRVTRKLRDMMKEAIGV